MRILYLTLELPLDPDAVATGNQLRADMLGSALADAGHEIVWHVHEPSKEREIAQRIRQERPDALLLGYWQLAEWLPDDLDLPVVIDCIAPRPLEEHFVNPETTAAFIRRYLRALSRADLVLVGNTGQRTLLVGWLLSAGEDLRSNVPIVEVPLAVDAPERARSDHGEPLVLVTGGQDWPWRDASRWLHALDGPDRSDRIEMHHFGAREIGGDAIEHGLKSWRDWQGFLQGSAHVGVELAEPNIERELAQPFRIASFLQAGLPLLINDYLPVAAKVREYDAGWVVDSPESARSAACEALRNPDRWRAKALGANRLAIEHFRRDDCARPLLEWLAAPRKRHSNLATGGRASRTASLERQPSLLGMAVRLLLRPIRRNVAGDGVVVITRSDLFPTDHGAAVKIIETARGLARSGRTVAIVTADRGRYWLVGETGIEARPLPRWLRALALPKILSHTIHRLRGLPDSNAFLYWPLYDPGYGLRAAWVGRAIGARVALAEFPAYAQSARICRLLNGGEAVLVEHNVEYQRLADQIPQLSGRAFRKLKDDELKMANCMDAVVSVSDRDRAQLIADGLSPDHQLTIPHGVDLPAFEATEPADLADAFGFDTDRPVLAYHGTFSYPPNRQALEILIGELLPRLARLGHRVQLLAVGSFPPPLIDHPDVRLPGSLKELAGPLKACTLAAVPLTSGGGTRMKILDYFAAGLPVVSTAKGCEGLPVGDGKELLIRNDWDEFARAVAQLLEDDARRKTLGEAGHEMAKRLSWQEIAGRYDRLFRKLT